MYFANVFNGHWFMAGDTWSHLFAQLGASLAVQSEQLFLAKPLSYLTIL
jgi:hypothetical protein